MRIIKNMNITQSSSDLSRMGLTTRFYSNHPPAYIRWWRRFYNANKDSVALIERLKGCNRKDKLRRYYAECKIFLDDNDIGTNGIWIASNTLRQDPWYDGLSLFNLKNFPTVEHLKIAVTFLILTERWPENGLDKFSPKGEV